jgi:hypothetical protein
VGYFAALASPTSYSCQTFESGQQCINAIYNPTLRLLDMVMLAVDATVSFCHLDMESRFLAGPISCAAVAFSFRA